MITTAPIPVSDASTMDLHANELLVGGVVIGTVVRTIQPRSQRLDPATPLAVVVELVADPSLLAPHAIVEGWIFGIPTRLRLDRIIGSWGKGAPGRVILEACSLSSADHCAADARCAETIVAS